MTSIALTLPERLVMYAQQLEDQHGPQHLSIAMREAATEIERLRAGGCARDQGTTQFCAEAAHKAAYIVKIDAKMQRWRMALVNIAQGKGDPVVVACKALEADND